MIPCRKNRGLRNKYVVSILLRRLMYVYIVYIYMYTIHVYTSVPIHYRTQVVHAFTYALTYAA